VWQTVRRSDRIYHG